MKACPFCAEMIQDAAILCRYCGRDLVEKPEPKAWRTMAIVLHWRNMDESGWLKAEGTPAAAAQDYFWNQQQMSVAGMDEGMVKDGWLIAGPRGPACVEIETVRNRKGQSGLGMAAAAVFSYGTSLVFDRGYEKWWMKSLTLLWRRPVEEESSETINLWMNPKNKNEFERIELDANNGKWFVWRRPADFDVDDPNDDRWDKTPF